MKESIVREHDALTAVANTLAGCERAASSQELVALVLEVLAVHYHADACAYLPGGGGFVLEMWRGPAALPPAAKLFSHPAFDADEVAEIAVLEAGPVPWVGAATLVAPIFVDESVEWLLAVASDRPGELAPALRILQRTTALALVRLHREADERLQRSIIDLLTPGYAPFDAAAQLALDAILTAIDGSAGQMVVDEGDRLRPAVVVRRDPVDVQPWQMPDAAPDDLVVRSTGGSNLMITFRFHRDRGVFPPSASRRVEAAAALVSTWLAGVALFRDDVQTTRASGASADLMHCLSLHLDGLGRIAVDGALAIVLRGPARLAAAAPGDDLDQLVGFVETQVRRSDRVGMLTAAAAADGAGALLIGAAFDAAPAILDRLAEAARHDRLDDVRLSVVSFAASTLTPGALLERALAHAARPSTSET
jgi:hypothetical protein